MMLPPIVTATAHAAVLCAQLSIEPCNPEMLMWKWISAAAPGTRHALTCPIERVCDVDGCEWIGTYRYVMEDDVHYSLGGRWYVCPFPMGEKPRPRSPR